MHQAFVQVVHQTKRCRLSGVTLRQRSCWGGPSVRWRLANHCLSIKAVGSSGAGYPSAGGQRAIGAARRKIRSQPSKSEPLLKQGTEAKEECQGNASSCQSRALCRPCRVPQRRVAGVVQAPASPVPPALSRLATRNTGTPRHRKWLYATVGPNPSIERTHNGGAQCLAPSRVVPPLCAAHVKR